MPESSIEKRFSMISTEPLNSEANFAKDVHEGLSSKPKTLPSIYFYDYQGSLLFEEICRLPEYYLTRAESEILETYRDEIINHLEKDTQLVELGSGSSIKTQLIIEQFLDEYKKAHYSPIDISKKMLKNSSYSLLNRYSQLHITSVAAEYNEGLKHLNLENDKAKLIIWLGSSIGNFHPDESTEFVKQLSQQLEPQRDYCLIGFDLRKDRKILEQAYDDAEGITAQFNFNILTRINRDLGGQFDLHNFRHLARYNEDEGRVEMHLVSEQAQQVFIRQLNNHYQFETDETIHTENSYKFSQSQIDNLARQTGLYVHQRWFDSQNLFTLVLFRKV
ncbi:MAG: L-histidine N(alpha)-methyltransferase [Caldithrix sp.]|nr:L-histidine N(alpha)-methyltransferase [Caldithrix sp.]